MYYDLESKNDEKKFFDKYLEAAANGEVANYIRGTEKYFFVPSEAYQFNNIYKCGENNYFFSIVNSGLIPACENYITGKINVINAFEELLSSNDIYDLFCCFSCLIEIIRYDSFKKMKFTNEEWNNITAKTSKLISDNKDALNRKKFLNTDLTYYEYMKKMYDDVQEFVNKNQIML